MDGKRNIDNVENAAGDISTVTAEASLSAPLHVTFDEPLTTVCQENEEGEVVTVSEPVTGIITSVRPSPVVVDKPSTAVVDNSIIMGIGDRRRSRRRSGRRRSRKSHERRIRSRSRLNRNYYSDHSVVVQSTEDEPDSDHRRGGGRKSRE